MTIRIGIVNLKFDPGAWVSRLEASPTKKDYNFRTKLHLCCGNGILPWERLPASISLPKKKGLDARICLANKPRIAETNNIVKGESQ